MADDAQRSASPIAFGPFRLFVSERMLLEEEQSVSLGGRAFDLLTALISRAGAVVSNKELISLVWPDVFVESGTLRVHLAALRRALGDGRAGRRFIVNSPGRGYSFVAALGQAPPLAAEGKLKSPLPRLDNLPALPTRMFGRERQVEALIAQLSERRFVTITGPGGIGKTTLALTVASTIRLSYREGCHFADLAPIRDPALVATVLASSLGLPVSSGDPIPALVAVLRTMSMLVVLDNCEHVIVAAARLAEEISKGAPEVHVLATSREALRARGEHIHRLRPLEAPPPSSEPTAEQVLTFPAVQLFVERASASLEAFEVSDGNAPAIGEICRRLDGIPLALEMAAGRVDILGVHGVAAWLDDRFALLKQGHRTASPQHKTLRATFDWSWHLLSPVTRVVFRRLSIFAGDISIEAATVIAAGAGDIAASDAVDAIAQLVAASLLSANVSTEKAAYRFLESTRAYARSKLLDSGELDHVCNRHAEYILAVLQRTETVATSAPAATAESSLKSLTDDLRIALDWTSTLPSENRLGIRLTIAGIHLWARLSLHEECRSRVEIAIAALARLPVPDHDSEMRLHAALGTVLAYTKSAEANAAWSKVLKLSEQLEDTDYQLRALRGLWTSTFSAGHLQAAVKLNKQHVEIASLSKEPDEAFHSVRMRGMTHFYGGRFKLAQADLEYALGGYSKSNKLDLVRFQFDQNALVCVGLSKTLWIRGFPDQAMAITDRAVTYATAAKHELSVIYSLAYGACRMAIAIGDLQKAESCIEMLTRNALRHPLVLWDIMAECWKGVLLARQGSVAAAVSVLGKALVAIPEGSFSLHYSRFAGEYAHALGKNGEIGRALETINRVIDVCRRLRERWYLAELLRIKGEIVSCSTEPDAAVQAESIFVNSLEIADRQGATSWQLRTATSLAQLYFSQGRHSQGHDLLFAVYSRLREGFETGDVQLAKSILDIRGLHPPKPRVPSFAPGLPNRS